MRHVRRASAVTFTALFVAMGNYLILGGPEFPTASAAATFKEDNECILKSGGRCLFNPACFNTTGNCPNKTYKSRVHDLDPYKQCWKDDTLCCKSNDGAATVVCATTQFYEEEDCFVHIAGCDADIEKLPCTESVDPADCGP
jgi:hypothetical protein